MGPQRCLISALARTSYIVNCTLLSQTLERMKRLIQNCQCSMLSGIILFHDNTQSHDNTHGDISDILYLPFLYSPDTGHQVTFSCCGGMVEKTDGRLLSGEDIESCSMLLQVFI